MAVSAHVIKSTWFYSATLYITSDKFFCLNSTNWSNVGLYTSGWEEPCFIAELSSWFPQVSLFGSITMNWYGILKICGIELDTVITQCIGTDVYR